MRGRGLGRVFAASGDGSYLLTSVLPKPASLAVQSPFLDISMPDLLQGWGCSETDSPVFFPWVLCTLGKPSLMHWGIGCQCLGRSQSMRQYPDICQGMLMQKEKLVENRSLKHAFPAPVANPRWFWCSLALSGPVFLQDACASPQCLEVEQVQKR